MHSHAAATGMGWMCRNQPYVEQAGSTALFPSATNDARLGITNKNFLVGAGTARYVVIGGESPRVTNVVLVLHAPFIGASVLIGMT